MRFLRAFAVTGLLLLTLAPAVRADDQDTKSAKIHELFRVTKMDSLLKQSLETLSSQMQSGVYQQIFGVSELPSEAQATVLELQAKLVKLISGALDWNAMEADYVKLYSEAFSESEIDSVLAFYKSPAGQEFVNKTPLMMQQGGAIAQKRIQSVQPQIQALMKEYKDKIGQQ